MSSVPTGSPIANDNKKIDINTATNNNISFVIVDTFFIVMLVALPVCVLPADADSCIMVLKLLSRILFCHSQTMFINNMSNYIIFFL